MYEIQTMKPSFPISFHTDKLCGISRPHWHENIEILHLISGSAKMVIDSQTVLWSPGETIIVNTNSIHQFFPKSTEIEYHCLNININFLEQMGINLNDNYIKAKVRDTEISDLFALEGIEVTAEEIDAAYDAIEADKEKEFSEDELDKVSGGIFISGGAFLAYSIIYSAVTLQSAYTLGKANRKRK